MRVLVLALLACAAVALAQDCLPDGGVNFSGNYFAASGPLCIKPCTATCVPTPGQTTGIYYTTYNGGQNIWKADLVIDDNAVPPTITTNFDRNVASTPGADGILGSPIGNKLYIGGQAGHINVYDLVLQTNTKVNSPVAVYHMTVVDGVFSSAVVFGSDIGTRRVAKFIINPSDGTLSTGTLVSVSGNSGRGITTLIKAPRGFYYVADSTGSAGSSGEFGTAVPNADGSAFTVTPFTAAKFTNLGGCYHGGYYDPYSASVLLWGANKICQYVIATEEFIVETASGVQYDQGTPDGLGHIFVANNHGTLDWYNYRSSKRINDTEAKGVLLTRGFLDDVAPLVGGGSAC